MVLIITEDFEYESYSKRYHCYGDYTQSVVETGAQGIFLYVMVGSIVSFALPYHHKYTIVGIEVI